MDRLKAHVIAYGLVVHLLIATDAKIAVTQFNPCSDGESCVNIRKCTLFSPHFEQSAHWSDDQRVAFDKRVCEQEQTSFGMTYNVCCGAEDTRKQGLELLDLEACGATTGDSVPSVAPGEDTLIYKFPWLAVIYYYTDVFCTGSLISDRYVVTVAHCLHDPAETHVHLDFVGAHHRNNIRECENYPVLDAKSQQVIGVESAIRHPQFKGPYEKNDVGVLRLARKVSFSDNLHPICLPVFPAPHRAEEANAPTTPPRYTIVGWVEKENDPVWSRLQSIKSEELPKDQCRLKSCVNELLDSHVCVMGQNMSQFCYGSAGLPLTAPPSVESNGRYVLHGLISFPSQCPDSGEDVDTSGPHIYTRVDSVLSWILDNLVE
uniref:Peptidase S1 domain-containing protein n=1 Tax=Anopheles dirus TaxID=7168 RepID=A0A182NFB1_9DIPT